MAVQEVTPAERIRELLTISAHVPGMLESAGKALNALTNSPLSKSGDGEAMEIENGSISATVDRRKAAFEEHTKAYYTSLQAVVARLRRQAYALEEAGIIDPDKPDKTSGSAKETERIMNGGLGNLDVGWLNSRGNKAGAEKENELVEEAKKLLEETLSRDQVPKGPDGT